MARLSFLLALSLLAFLPNAQAQSSDPKVTAKAAEARKAYAAKDYKGCNKLFAEAIKMGAGAPGTHYDYACCLALSGDTAEALTQLHLAAKKGYKNLGHVAADKDLDPVRNLPRFRTFVAKMKEAQEAYYRSLQFPDLARQLDKIYETDQAGRSLMGDLYAKNDTAALRKLWQKQHLIDSANQLAVVAMIEKVGRWPGYKEVGEEGSNTVWIVIQHAPLQTQEKYLPMLEKAVAQKNASEVNLAYLQDRILMYQGKPQIYGTQARQNPDTKKMEIAPMVEPAKVDERRAKIGLGPLSDYKKQMGIKD